MDLGVGRGLCERDQEWSMYRRKNNDKIMGDYRDHCLELGCLVGECLVGALVGLKAIQSPIVSFAVPKEAVWLAKGHLLFLLKPPVIPHRGAHLATAIYRTIPEHEVILKLLADVPKSIGKRLSTIYRLGILKMGANFMGMGCTGLSIICTRNVRTSGCVL